MAEIDDRLGTELLELTHRLVTPRPVVLRRASEDQVQRRPIADVRDPDLARELEILAPTLVMPGRVHLVAAPAPVLGRGIAALDSGREDESGVGSFALTRPLARRRVPPRLRQLTSGSIADGVSVDRPDRQAKDGMPQ